MTPNLGWLTLLIPLTMFIKTMLFSEIGFIQHLGEFHTILFIDSDLYYSIHSMKYCPEASLMRQKDVVTVVKSPATTNSEFIDSKANNFDVSSAHLQQGRVAKAIWRLQAVENIRSPLRLGLAVANRASQFSQQPEAFASYGKPSDKVGQTSGGRCGVLLEWLDRGVNHQRRLAIEENWYEHKYL